MRFRRARSRTELSYRAVFEFEEKILDIEPDQRRVGDSEQIAQLIRRALRVTARASGRRTGRDLGPLYPAG
jgi:hypothetical protein